MRKAITMMRVFRWRTTLLARLDAAWAAWPLLQVAHGPHFLGGFTAECTGTSTCTDVSSKEAQYVNSFFRGFKMGTINRFVYSSSLVHWRFCSNENPAETNIRRWPEAEGRAGYTD
jgi:hypothetical protein